MTAIDFEEWTTLRAGEVTLFNDIVVYNMLASGKWRCEPDLGRLYNRFGREIKGSINAGGYRIITVSAESRDGSRVFFTVPLQRIVVAAKCGLWTFISCGDDIHHKDGNKLNNAFDNLEIVPRSAHRASHLVRAFADVKDEYIRLFNGSANRKFSLRDVQEIRVCMDCFSPGGPARGYLVRRFCESFAVEDTAIYRMAGRKTYKIVPDADETRRSEILSKYAPVLDSAAALEKSRKTVNNPEVSV